MLSPRYTTRIKDIPKIK
ncbi:DUF4113 domain-containing protein [Pantoea agglomerans]